MGIKRIIALLGMSLCLTSGLFTTLGAESADSSSAGNGKYEKTFLKDRTCRTYSCKGGFIKFHTIGKKLYIELSKEAFGKRMLLSSTVTAVSDPEVLTVGYKPVKPLYVRFDRPDSLTINLCEVNLLPDYDKGNEAIATAVRRTSMDTVLETFALFCESPDSSSVVFEATSFFNGDNSRLGPVKSGTSNHVTTKFTLKKASDIITGIKVFKDNATLCSSHTYSVSSDVLGLVTLKKDEPFTVSTTRTFLMLPEERMQTRKADSRVGIFLTTKRRISEDTDGIATYSVINRWNVYPSDTAAYMRGELVEPVEHIVFYMDDAFPGQWKEAARRGILRWNSAFEDIGFKDVIQVKDFPDDDPEFDPDNLKYSCVRYVPSTVANAMGPSWVDPETGEIINASVIVYNDVVKLAGGWRFCQTAQLDRRARLPKMPQDLMEETMEYIVAHEMGHCLGFMHNMAASAAFPTDSLRSASFTRKYGTTASIMDYARFNYIAQPSDTGVVLDPPYLGAYDRFLVRYAYSFIPVDADSTVEGWVDENAGNPVYRYGRQQVAGRYDPSAWEEDLGDDPIMSSEYGISNLKYILGHFNEWMPDTLDADGSLKLARYDLIVKQFGRYLNAVSANVGGICITQTKAGTDDVQAVRTLPAGVQRKSLLWVLDQLGSMDWLLWKSVGNVCQVAVDKADVLLFNTASDLFSSWENVVLNSYLAGDGGYGLEEWMEDIDSVIWKGRPANAMMTLQKIYVASVITAATKKTSTSKLSLLADDACPDEEAFGPAGYNWQKKVNIKAISNSKELFYGELMALRRRVSSKARTCTDRSLRAHYLSLEKDISSAL